MSKKSYSNKSIEIMKFLNGEKTNLNDIEVKTIQGIKDYMGVIKLIKRNKVVADKIYKINYNPNGNWIALSGWQRTVETIIGETGFIFDKSISSKKNFLLFLEEYGIAEFLNLMFNSIRTEDVLVKINRDLTNYSFYDLSSISIDFEDQEIDTNILEDANVDTWYIWINGIKMFQLQVPPSTGRPNNLILRVDRGKIPTFAKELIRTKEKTKRTNETLGISTEVAICNVFNLEIPEKYEGRWDDGWVEEISNSILKNKSMFPADISSCEGAKGSGYKKSPYDFIRDCGKTISVKSNMIKRNRVCPPEIGQPGLSQGTEHYNKIFGTNYEVDELFDRSDNCLLFKNLFVKNILEVLKKQFEHLFSEDSLIWFRQTDGDYKIKVYHQPIKLAVLDINKISFTRMPSEWNESTSIKYDGVSIAEMQIHSKRNTKFRFNMLNIEKIMA